VSGRRIGKGKNGHFELRQVVRYWHTATVGIGEDVELREAVEGWNLGAVELWALVIAWGLTDTERFSFIIILEPILNFLKLLCVQSKYIPALSCGCDQYERIIRVM
jgi:hypothetical protein